MEKLFQRGASQFAWEESQFTRARDLLFSAQKLALDSAASGLVSWRQAQLLAASSKVERRALAPEAFERALDQLEDAESRARALYEFASLLMQRGGATQDAQGQWREHPDFPRAVALLRELLETYQPGEVSVRRGAENRLRSLVDPSLNVYARHQFYPDQEPQFSLQWRNVSQVRFRLQSASFDGLAPGRSSRWRPGDLASLVDGPTARTLQEWTFDTEDAGRHEPGSREAMALPHALEPGWYLLTATGAGQSARTLIQVGHLIAWLAPTEEGVSAHVAEAMTGEPIPEARVVLWVGDYQNNRWVWERTDGRSDAAGYADFSVDGGQRRFVVVTDGASIAVTGDVGQAPGQLPMRWTGYGVADRPLYRPGETIQWKWTGRQGRGARYETPASEPVRFEIVGPRGATVSEGVVAMNAFGSISGAVTSNPEWALGVYRLNVGSTQPNTGFFHSEALFRLESFEPPEFQVSVAAPAEDGRTVVFRPGADVTVDVSAEYYAGGAVVGAEVELLITRQPLWFHWGPEPRPYWMMADAMIAPRRPEQGSTEPWKRLTGTTDGAGKARFIFAAEGEDLDRDWQFVLEARVTDVSRQMVAGEGIVKTTRRPYVVKPSTERVLYEPGQAVALRLHAKDANEQPVAARGAVEVVEVSTKTVWTRPDGVVLTPDAVVEARRRYPVFPPPSADGPWRREDQTVERIVERQPIVMNSDGEAHWEFRPSARGTLRFRWVPSEFVVSAHERDSTDIWVVREALDASGYHQGALRWIADTEEVESGDTLTALLTAPVSGRWAQVFIETGSALERRSVRIEGTARAIRVPITRGHTPNFFLHAISVADLRVDRDTLEIAAAPADQFLDVTLITRPQSPQPGDVGELEALVVDRNGNPVETELTLRMFDEALSAISESMGQDPRAVFYGQRRYSWFRPELSLAPSAFKPRYLLDGEAVDAADAMGRGGVLKAAGGMAAMARGAPMAMRAMAESAPAMLADAEGGAPGSEAVRLRTNFALTALWAAEVTTDETGRATLPFVYPDSLTQWRTEARAVSKETEVGMATERTRVSKPLMARLQAPRFLIQGDRATVSVTVQNATESALSLAPLLRVDGVLQPAVSERSAPPGESLGFDWEIDASTAESVTLEAQVVSGAFADAVQRVVPVMEYGAPVWITRAGQSVAPETELTFVVPERRREGSAELTLQLTPSLSGALLDATPYLVRYPYGCVEQTLSRFLPAAMVRNVLADQGLGVKAATQWVNRRLEEGMVGFSPREGTEPLSELDQVVEEGLARLVELQSADGGWGWWPGGRSQLYMSAYVTWGLSLGADAGLAVDPGVLRRARSFLAKGLIEARSDIDLVAWTLHAIGDAELAPADAALVTQAVEALWERHPQLTSYGRALFALALHRCGMEERARILAANLSNGVLYDEGRSLLDAGIPAGAAATASWGARSDWRRWHRSPVESTAFALMALLEIDPDSRWTQPAVTWLLNNRTGARWGHTKETAIAVLALRSFVVASDTAEATWEYDVLWNGRVVARAKVDPNAPLAGEVRVVLDDDAIDSGSNRLAVRGAGAATPLYYAAQLRYFDQSQAIAPQSSEIAVRQRFARQKSVETLLDGLKSEWEPIDAATALQSGDIIECVLTIETKNDLEYLMFEAPRAAGLEPLERQSGYGVVSRIPVAELDQWERRVLGSRSAYREFRRQHVAVFVDRLEQGVWEFRYRFRAVTPGRFSGPPAVGEAMYVPRIRANSANASLTITSE